MALPVKLDNFEGPLDLLLHLIDVNQFNIFDIPIVEITAQYLEYIQSESMDDLNVMSEFLVMAATLLDIKAKMLLPAQVNEEGEEIDPREELVNKLLEYKMYKYMSFELKDRYQQADQVMYRNPQIPKIVEEYMEPVDLNKLLDGVTLSRLNKVFLSIVKKQSDRIDPIRSKFGTIEREEVSLDGKMDEIMNKAKGGDSISFHGILAGQKGKMQVVVTFLAILELMKMGKIKVYQERTFDDILIQGLEGI